MRLFERLYVYTAVLGCRYCGFSEVGEWQYVFTFSSQLGL